MAEEEVPPEIEGKYLQFLRVLMSYVDFQQASGIATCILESDLLERYPEDRFHLQGLNSGLIVAYWRPFTTERAREGGQRVPPLSGSILSALDTEERELHEIVRKDRNQVVAHSDSDAWNPRPYYLRLNGRKILYPQFSSAHAHLLRPAVGRLAEMCTKLREACFAERERLEPELEPYLSVLEPDPEELRSAADELGVELPE